MTMVANAKTGYWRRLQAVALTTSLLTLSFAYPVMSQERMMRTLTVTGRGKESIQTTQAVVRLGVEAQGKTAKDVQAEVARRSNSVVSLLKARGVEKLETTGINLNPTYNYDNGKQTLIGYAGSNIVSFRSAIPETGKIIDDAVNAGASRIDGVGFMALDSAIATAQKEALKKATQDAQTQADAVFGALSITKKEIVGIQVNGAYAPAPVLVNFKSRLSQADAAAPSPVMGGEQDVEASVTLQISY